MTYNIGDPNHIGVHNQLASDVAQQAATFGVEVTLPPQRNLGDRQHVDDHNLLATAIQAIADYSGPLPSTTTVFGITATQDFTVPANATQVDVYAVGGGSGGGYGSWGGSGSIREVTDHAVTGGQTLVITVGAGGVAAAAGGTTSVTGIDGTIVTASGGTVGSRSDAAPGTWHDVWGWKGANGANNGNPRGVPTGGGGSGSTSCRSGGQAAASYTGSGGGGSGGGPSAGAGGSGFVGLIFR